jgi:hypothetical protein
MTISGLTAARHSASSLERSLDLACFALVAAYVVYVGASFVVGLWLVNLDGSRNATDFVNVWAAGRLVIEGHPASVYDWPVHKAMEVAALGHPFDGYFGWHYPPPFLFVAAGLALMPYGAAAVAWTLGTLPLYLGAIRTIIGDRSGFMLAAAFPAVLCNTVVGQNGFLSAGLLGGALVLVERRPIAAGVLIGLLTYKPHLGLLVPIALAAGGYWRTFTTAAVVATAMVFASWLAFGTDTWIGFIGNIGHTSEAFLVNGWADFGKLQTAFGLVRWLGGSEAAAWIVQGAVALAAAAAIGWVWKRDLDFGLKAATLGIGALLATPYLYTYDLVVLAVPFAFLWRSARVRGFPPYELAGISGACALILAFPFVTAPVGFIAVLVAATLTARRVAMAEAR